MLRRTALLAFVPLVSLALVAAATTQAGTSTGRESNTQNTTKPAITKGTLVKIQGQILIKANNATVWAALTTTEGLGKVTGLKGLPAGGKFSKTGDAFPGTAWTDAGLVTCTYFGKETELRTAFEPTSAGYLCQYRIILQRDPSNGTMLTVLDRYTDDNEAAAVDATATIVANQLATQLEAFRVSVEMP
ncbi:MAG: hypothetical protein ACKVXR_00745 [Planctomycetota bacterium]